jgi:hypothetical protein
VGLRGACLALHPAVIVRPARLIYGLIVFKPNQTNQWGEHGARRISTWCWAQA